MQRGRVVAGVLGALIYAAGGAYMGSMNAGWFGVERGANRVLVVLGVGAALVVVAFARSWFSESVGRTGVGIAALILLCLGPVLNIVSWLIEFAIFGTLALAAGLVCLAITVVMRRLATPVDRVLIVLSAVGSFTWNTETTSAFILVGIGLIWAVLSVRLLSSGRVPTPPETAAEAAAA